MHPDIRIVAAAIAVVWIIRVLVVFKAVDPEVVVHVHAKQKLRAIYVVAQERLLVVGDEIWPELIVILVEIRDEVEVFVPAGKNPQIRPKLVEALPVGDAVLVVVVVNPLVIIGRGIGIVDVARGRGNQAGGAVVVIHAVGLGKEKIGIALLRQIDHIGIGLILSRVVGRKRAVRVFAIVPTAVEFRVQIKTQHTLHLQGKPVDVVARRQAVVEAQQPQVGAVLDVASRPLHRQKNGLPLGYVELAIRTHLDVVVVGHHQLDLRAANGGKLRAGVRRRAEVVGHFDSLGTIGREESEAL